MRPPTNAPMRNEVASEESRRQMPVSGRNNRQKDPSATKMAIAPNVAPRPNRYKTPFTFSLFGLLSAISILQYFLGKGILV